MSLFNLGKNSSHKQSFYTAYHKTFEVVRADSMDLKEEVFRLRHQIYCVENGFIDPEISTSGQERDIYDRHSEHLLLIHRQSGRAVGTARVILSRTDHPLRSFPIQSASDHPLLYKEECTDQLCEISRLCMSKAFRRREGDGNLLPAYSETDWEKKPNTEEKVTYFRRMIPYAPLGLMRGAFEIALEYGVTTCFCVIDEDQTIAMQQAGLKHKKLGDPIDFFGRQQPVIFHIKDVLAHMLRENAPCWDIVSDGSRLQSKANKMPYEDWHDEFFSEEEAGFSNSAKRLP